MCVCFNCVCAWLMYGVACFFVALFLHVFVYVCSGWGALFVLSMCV